MYKSKPISFGSKISIGLDISPDSIKLVKIKKKRSGYQLLSCAQIPASGLKDKSSSEQIKVVLDALKKELKDRRGKSVDAFIAVSGEGVTIRNITIPPVSKSELNQAIQWASQKQLPFPLDEVHFDYKVLGNIQEKAVTKKEVIIAAATKNLINEHLSYLNRLHIKVAGISVIPIALGNLNKVSNLSLTSSIMVNIGAKLTTIAIFQDNVLKLSREILTAGESLTKSPLASDENSPDPSDTANSSIDRLVSEINRSISFCQQRYPNIHIDKVYISGEAPIIRELPWIMQGKLGIIAEVINPCENIKLLLPPEEIDKIKESAPTFSVAIGLALEADEGINLLPKSIQEQKALKRIGLILSLSAITLGVILLGFYLDISLKVKNSQKILNLNNNQLETLKSTIPSAKEISERTKHIKVMEATIEQLKGQHGIDPYILKEISNIIPESVALKNISIEGINQDSIPGEKSSSNENQNTKEKAELNKGQNLQNAKAKIDGVICRGEPATYGVNLTQLLMNLYSSPFFENPNLLSKGNRTIKGRDVLEFSINSGVK